MESTQIVKSLSTNERIFLYQFFCELFYSPLDISYLDRIREWSEEDELTNVFQRYPEFQKFLKIFSENETKQLLEEWKQEYQSIFYIFNPDGKIQAPLWESYYTTSDHSLFGHTTYSLRNKLHEFNLQYELENSHPEDHLSIELDFLQHLIIYTEEAALEQNSTAYEKGIYTQFWLIKDRLLKWLPNYLTKLEIANKESIYYSFSILLIDILREDLCLIKIHKEEMENDKRFS